MQAEFDIVINLTRKEGSSKPKGWLADAELVFNDGDLKGLSLVGFMVRETGNKLGEDFEVTFPSRSYTGKKDDKTRYFDLLRSTNWKDRDGEKKLAQAIFDAYKAATKPADK
jgi:hypothetical protein